MKLDLPELFYALAEDLSSNFCLHFITIYSKEDTDSL